MFCVRYDDVEEENLFIFRSSDPFIVFFSDSLSYSVENGCTQMSLTH